MSYHSELIASDIQEYLHQHENKELLRFLTCGSVDDGKSTLIGRLLHDSKMIYEDQLAAIQKDNERVGNAGEELDLALLVDGLQAEREQGITIDVAYRYFSTSKRKFIIADTPGHEQYTRNMATGASTCDLAIILIDARYGVQVQTKRHSFIVSLLGLKHTVVAINKMDLVDYSEERFEEIKAEYLAFSEQLDLPDIQFVPISALKGDNVVTPSEPMAWFDGAPLMDTLENVEIANDKNFDDLRFPVQYVNRPNLDEVTVLPSGKSSTVKSIVTFEGEIEEAFPPMAVTLTLDDEIDISRGDVLVHSASVPATTNRFDAMVVWMSEEAMQSGRQYEVKLNTTRVAGGISNVHNRIDVNTLEESAANTLALNEIGRCEITLERPVVADDYRSHHGTGSFIIVDRLTNATVAAGMIINDGAQQAVDLAHNLVSEPKVTAADRMIRFGQQGATVTISGGTEAQRQTLLFSLEAVLFEQGRNVVAFNRTQLADLDGNLSSLAPLFNAAGLISLLETDAALEGAVNLQIDQLAGDTAFVQLEAAIAELKAQALI
jgi:bifunctional enzyme CysN/CysC